MEKKLKKKAHVDIARLQDELMRILYGIDSRLVLHDGTSIWRCYGGGRFSEDLDLYIGEKNGAQIVDELKDECESTELKIDKLKETDNLIFCKISDGDTQARIEINKNRHLNTIALHYENANGSKMIVMGLGIEDLLAEKANAYLSRKLIRDIYDVYFLSGLLPLGKKMPKEVEMMVNKLPKPLDEDNLSAIVYLGAVPSFDSMIRMIKARLR